MTINARSCLHRIEAKHHQGERPLVATFIRSDSDEDRNRQLAEHMAAGTYRPGWPLIYLRAPRLTEGTARP